jgi:peptidoglycan/LPS O-acetylase OafA/YrhL
VGSGSSRVDRGRFALVDSLRALAALSVVYYHVAFRFALPTGVNEYLTQRNAGPPVTAVVLFFLISGFVLYRPFVAARFDGRPPPPSIPYAIRRFARIVPGYWVTLAIVSAWLGYSYVLTPQGFLRYFCFLQLYGDQRTLNGGISVAWSLCVEVTFYIALPLLALTARRLGRRRSVLSSELILLTGMVLASLVWQLIVSSLDKGDWALSMLSMLPGSLDLFAAGMLLAVLSVEHEHRPTPRRMTAVIDAAPWLPWLLALGVLYAEGVVAAIPTHPHSHMSLTAWWMSTHALKLLACALLLAPAVLGRQDRGLLRRALGARPLVWLGTVSYGIYLWHFPVLDKLDQDLVPHGELYTTLAVAAISIALGALSYYLVERPAQRLARRLLRARAPAPAPIAAAP